LKSYYVRADADEKLQRVTVRNLSYFHVDVIFHLRKNKSENVVEYGSRRRST